MKSTSTKAILIVALAMVVLLAAAATALSQIAAPKIIQCATCKYENDWAYKFCIKCGADLTAMKEARLAELQREHEAKLAAARQKALEDSLARAAAKEAQVAREKQAEQQRLEAERKAKEAEAQKKMEKAAMARSQEERPKKPAVKIYEGPVDPRRLFLIPTADILGPLEISMGGGSVIGEMGEEKRPFLGRLSIGLGGVAEIEASTIGIVSGLAKGSATIPTAAFKLKFLPETNRFPFAGIAGALRSSTWYSEQRDTVKFEKRESTLYFVASKTFGAVSMHAGLSISDLRIRTRDAATGAFISPTPIKRKDRDYVNENLFSPFVGLRVEVNPGTLLMLEYESIPEYDFDEENPVVDKGKIDEVWMIIAGVRYFIFDWLPLDTGVLYRGDYHGIGDMHIQAGLNINLPLPRIARAMAAK
jgi:flagellar biosynthesis GTPase FlhF